MIVYLLSFSLCSGLLLLVYKVLLSPEKFYKFNRFYLFFSLIFSLLVPIISLQYSFDGSPDLNRQSMNRKGAAFLLPSVITVKEQIAKATSDLNVDKVVIKNTISNKDIIIFISSLITITMCVRFLRNLHRICSDINFSSIVNINNIKIVLLDKHITPYSFLKYVFVNKKDFLNDLTEPEIICHEQAHAAQLHSLDIIFIELLQVICWFNPFIFLYRKAIRLNHEFLADQFVLENNYDTKAYQHLMVAKLNQSGVTYLTSQFNYLTIKKRLIMMNKETSGKSALYKQLAIVPIVLCAFIVFANANEIGKSAIIKESLESTNLFYHQHDKYSNTSSSNAAKTIISNKLTEPVKAKMADTSLSRRKKQNVNVVKSNRKRTTASVKAAEENTFSTNSPISSGLQNKHKGNFSTAPVVQEGDGSTFSTATGSTFSTGNSSTFSTTTGKRNSSTDVVDFTNKLILIKGREATEEELRSLSLEKIKFIKPFKGTDDFGTGTDTFEKKYGEKARNGGFWIVLKTPDN